MKILKFWAPWCVLKLNIKGAESQMQASRGVDRCFEIYACNKVIAWLEKQGEQTHAELNRLKVTSGQKLEPKFKVGDWIIFNENHNSAYQVDRIDNYRYYLRHYLGGTLSVPCNSELIRLWTIQDAKNGDIVYYECHDTKHLFIVKSVGETKDHVEGHFWYNITRNECEIWDGRLPYSNIASMWDAMPATKEQRDLLFEKMKEAGYEWDGKKKELKKIESKTLDADKVIEWLHDHIQVDEPEVEYSTDGQPLAESFLAHAKARCIAADEVVKQFKQDFGL